ncbi:hypothetical protein F8388_008306 [Cannabis sativa]|uniref:Protein DETOXIFICATION n=1 Tax=Cannabis sativa TaxID=3483 RepID=A0A7J6EMW0_CANSA|nr:hypothetical protein F8388_008306 [Cannabis sativa]
MNNNNMEEEQRARLLPKPVSSSITEQVNTTHLRKDLNEDDHDIVSEVKQQLQLAGPLICVNVLTYCLQVISVMFVGHLGELSLAGASMATSFASVTGFSLLIFIYAKEGQILLFLGQDPEISAEAGRYARFMIPSIFAYAVTQCHTKFLQTQNNVVPMMITAGITTLLHLFICWFMVFKSGLGNRGAAMANAISYWINALSLVLYVRISPLCKHTWTGFSMEAFHGIPKFLKLSIPSAVMLTLEIWSFEMMVLLSGFLPNPKLETSVLSISLNTCALVYMVPLGLSGVISTRISNELGAGRPQIARLALCVALCMVVAEGTLVGAVLILGRRIWGYCYSGEEEVVKYVGQMMILISISQFFDGIQSVLSGSVRGSGRQKIGAFANLAAYYLMGIPVALLLAFVFHIGGKGLWIGIIVALIMQALCLALITICTDWEKEVNNASDRVHGTKVAINDELS